MHMKGQGICCGPYLCLVVFLTVLLYPLPDLCNSATVGLLFKAVPVDREQIKSNMFLKNASFVSIYLNVVFSRPEGVGILPPQLMPEIVNK